jgi:hypothetical protein
MTTAPRRHAGADIAHFRIVATTQNLKAWPDPEVMTLFLKKLFVLLSNFYDMIGTVTLVSVVRLG